MRSDKSRPSPVPSHLSGSPAPHRLRIAYVINSVEGGGAALPVPAVTRVLRDHGAEVRLFALTPRDRRALPPIAESGLEAEVREGGERDHLAAYAWLDRAIRRYAPDCIWTSLTRATAIGQMVGLRRGIPVVSWQHAAYLKPANLRLLRATRNLSTLWVADSESVAALTAERLRVPPGRLMTWPIFAADPTAPVARPWRQGEALRVGSLGRLHRVKGYDVLVDALAILRARGFEPAAPFEIVIGGEGGEREAIDAAARAAGLDMVRLAGFTDRPRDFLAGLHLYLQPSRSEGLCVAVHEAMQAGLPTIVSAVGEMPWSVQHGATGLVVPPADPEALADALAAMLSAPDQLAAMGAASRQRVLDRFSVAAFSAAGGSVLERLDALVRAGPRFSRPANDRSV